jgi:hypothetical protein
MTTNYTVTVYQYGVDPRVPVPDGVDEQLRLAHELRNDLVRLELDHDAAREHHLAQFPRVQEIDTEIAAATLALQGLSKQAKSLRSAKGTKADAESVQLLLKKARVELCELRERRKDARDVLREQCRPVERVLAAKRDERVKVLYREYRDRGLYWASYNDVTDKHRIARQRLIAQRQKGVPARFRFHRWTGEGTIAVQLQRMTGDPPRTPALLASGGGKWRNVLRIEPWFPPEMWEQWDRAKQRQLARTGVVWWRTNVDQVAIPVVLARMLPAEADVTDARLTVRRVAGRRRMTVNVTARLPEVEPLSRPGAPVVTIRPRWKAAKDGLIVADWEATGPLPVPPKRLDLDAAVRTDDGVTGTILVPEYGTRRRLAEADEVQSARDRHLNEVHDGLLAALRAHPAPDGPTVREVAAWRQASGETTRYAYHRYAALANAWAVAAPPGLGEVADMLAAWRSADRRAWERETHLRRKAREHRLDTYRRVAAWLVESAGAVHIEQVSVAQSARAPQVGEAPRVPYQQADAARVNLRAAAPSELTGALANAARRVGVGYHVVTRSTASNPH